MFGNRQIAAIKGKYRRFLNYSECLKTHCTANNWPIWTQKSFFLILFINGRLSKIRSVHTYDMTRMVYFDWICKSKLPSQSALFIMPNLGWESFGELQIDLIKETTFHYSLLTEEKLWKKSYLAKKSIKSGTLSKHTPF